MRLSGPAAERYCRVAPKGEPQAGVLLHGGDAGHVAEMRRRLIARLIVESGDQATRMEAGDVRRDPAALYDALRAGGLFGGRPVVLVTGATDALAEAVAAALDGLAARTGVLVLEAGSLPARSGLRKLFEGERGLMALGLDAAADHGPEALAAALAEAGLTAGLTEEALGLLAAHLAEADRGSAARTIETIALSGLDASDRLDAAAVAALLPVTAETETDGLVAAVVLGRPAEVVRRLSRLAAGGTGEIVVAIQLGGFLRQFLDASVGGLAALRPPLWGRRRDVMTTALSFWREDEIEAALRAVQAADAELRSAGQRPSRAILERVLLRLAISAQTRASTQSRSV